MWKLLSSALRRRKKKHENYKISLKFQSSFIIWLYSYLLRRKELLIFLFLLMICLRLRARNSHSSYNRQPLLIDIFDYLKKIFAYFIKYLHSIHLSSVQLSFVYSLFAPLTNVLENAKLERQFTYHGLLSLTNVTMFNFWWSFYL